MTRTDATEAALRQFEALPRLAAEDEDLARRGRFLDCEFEIGVGAQSLRVVVRAGIVHAVVRGPFLLRSADFAIRAEPETWLAFLEPMPKAGVHDILALTKVGKARIEGNLVPFMANLQFVKDLLALPRLLVAEGTRP